MPMNPHSPPDAANPIRLGAMGWTYPAWQETFYPADMPVEWQLAYFNTQFNCVFLARARWQQAGPEQMAEWNADTHEKFLFLLEGGANLPMPTELAEKALMVEPDQASILWFTRDSSLKEMADALSGRAGVQPRFLISRDGDLDQMERVATLLDVMGLGF
jgi:hypothetical protein